MESISEWLAIFGDLFRSPAFVRANHDVCWIVFFGKLKTTKNAAWMDGMPLGLEIRTSHIANWSFMALQHKPFL